MNFENEWKNDKCYDYDRYRNFIQYNVLLSEKNVRNVFFYLWIHKHWCVEKSINWQHKPDWFKIWSKNLTNRNWHIIILWKQTNKYTITHKVMQIFKFKTWKKYHTISSIINSQYEKTTFSRESSNHFTKPSRENRYFPTRVAWRSDARAKPSENRKNIFRIRENLASNVAFGSRVASLSKIDLDVRRFSNVVLPQRRTRASQMSPNTFVLLSICIGTENFTKKSNETRENRDVCIFEWPNCDKVQNFLNKVDCQISGSFFIKNMNLSEKSDVHFASFPQYYVWKNQNGYHWSGD